MLLRQYEFVRCAMSRLMMLMFFIAVVIACGKKGNPLGVREIEKNISNHTPSTKLESCLHDPYWEFRKSSEALSEMLNENISIRGRGMAFESFEKGVAYLNERRRVDELYCLSEAICRGAGVGGVSGMFGFWFNLCEVL